MARITFSPIMVDARGKVGDAVFSNWKGISYIRSRVTPSNPQTSLQTAQRNALRDTLLLWQSIKSWAKARWDKYATGYAKSGYNRFIEDNVLHTKAATAGHLTPYNADVILVSSQDCAAGAAGEITCTWTNDTGIVGDMMNVYYRKTETGSEEYAWTYDSSTAVATETVTVSGLATAEEYELAMTASDNVLLQNQESYNEMLDAG